jgi:hypothetical protein
METFGSVEGQRISGDADRTPGKPMVKRGNRQRVVLCVAIGK